MKQKNLVTAGAVLGMAILLGFIWLPPSGNRQAPDLTLKSTTGKEIRIGSLKGRPVLVNFWATTCTPCLKEIPYLIHLYNELNSRGLVIIGVNMFYDLPIQVVEMIKQKGIPYPVILDTDRKIMHAFGMKQPLTPTTILIDTRGNIIYRKSGVPDMEKLGGKIIALLSSANEGK